MHFQPNSLLPRRPPEEGGGGATPLLQPEVQQFLGKNNNSPNLWRIAWDIQGNQRISANLLLFRPAAARLCEGSNFPVLSYDFTHSPILLLHEGERKSVAFFFSDAATEFFGLLFDIAPAEGGQRGSRNRTVEKRSIPESLPPWAADKETFFCLQFSVASGRRQRCAKKVPKLPTTSSSQESHHDHDISFRERRLRSRGKARRLES